MLGLFSMPIDNTNGYVLSDSRLDKPVYVPEWMDLPPGSSGDVLRKIVCENSSVEIEKKDIGKKTSSDWVEYGIDPEDSFHLYQKVSVQKNRGNHIVKIWDKDLMSDKTKKRYIQLRKKNGISTEGYEKLSHQQRLTEIDCKNQKIRVLYSVDQSKLGLKISDDPIFSKEWKLIIPDGIEDHLRKSVCQ